MVSTSSVVNNCIMIDFVERKGVQLNVPAEEFVSKKLTNKLKQQTQVRRITAHLNLAALYIVC